MAVPFKAPKSDIGLLPPVFKDKKELEKNLGFLQDIVGGVGVVSTKMLVLIEGKITRWFSGNNLKIY